MTDDSFPMTPAGKDKLRAELRQIKEIDRPENVREIEAALEHGDLRENAEYHSAKERQSMLASRMQYLEYRIARAMVIDPQAVPNKSRIGFGATVTLNNVDTDETVIYTLVGEDESAAERGLVSITSPIARALVGKRDGDEVVVTLPKGTSEYEITAIEYKAFEV